MSQKPNKHHFVPVCYLNNFLVDNTLYVLNLEGVKNGYNEYAKKSNPRKICYFDNYYKIDKNIFSGEGYDELFVESEVLKSLEDIYPGLYEKLTQESELEVKDCIAISDFIIQLKLRNPYWFNNDQLKIKNTVINETTISQFDSEKRFDSVPDELKELAISLALSNIKADINFDKRLQLTTLIKRHKEQSIDIRQAIINCKWDLLIAPKEGPYFITSDNPGVSVGNDKLLYNTRFKDRFTFYFPLSPLYCLLITDYEKDNALLNQQIIKNIEWRDVNKYIVFKVNDCLIQRVNKLLIANDKWYLNEIKKRNSPR